MISMTKYKQVNASSVLLPRGMAPVAEASFTNAQLSCHVQKFVGIAVDIWMRIWVVMENHYWDGLQEGNDKDKSQYRPTTLQPRPQ